MVVASESDYHHKKWTSPTLSASCPQTTGPNPKVTPEVEQRIGAVQTRSRLDANEVYQRDPAGHLDRRGPELPRQPPWNATCIWLLGFTARGGGDGGECEFRRCDLVVRCAVFCGDQDCR
jgi:hypothetical protein